MEGEPPKTRGVHLGPGWALATLAMCGLLAALGVATSDPDFFLPDVYRYATLWWVTVVGVSSFVSSPWLRTNLRVALGLVPVVVVLMAELWLSASDPSSRVVEAADPLLRFHYRPGHDTREIDASGDPVIITELGLWDRARPLAKPEGVTRVVLLGDSVPNDPSIPFAQRFPRVLERVLRERAPERRVEVINVSCEGFDTAQEVRFLELVGLRYDPDFVVLSFVANDPFIQNGGERRLGNSYALFPAMSVAASASGSICAMLGSLYEGWSYELMVGASFDHLAALGEAHGFDSLVAILPIMAPFDDEDCFAIYQQVAGSAERSGLPWVSLLGAFEGEDHAAYLKADEPLDVTHPNRAGHERYGAAIAEAVLARWTESASEERVDEGAGGGVAEDGEGPDQHQGHQDGEEPPLPALPEEGQDVAHE